MDPAVKTGMALCVLLAGMCAASLFPRKLPQPTPSAPAPAVELRIRSHTGPPTPVAPPPEVPEVRQTLPADPVVPVAPVIKRPLRVIKPLDQLPSPPPLAPNYPEQSRPASSRWGTSMEMMLSTKETARTHRIVDGDTLAALAQRYLGSAEDAQRLFDANRDVLSDPRLLPIGAELKIPANNPQPSRQ